MILSNFNWETKNKSTANGLGLFLCFEKKEVIRRKQARKMSESVREVSKAKE